jgi:hypothetical protein
MKTVTWYIFNVLGKRKHVSPTFLEAGFEWHIEAYPNGIDDTCKGCECLLSPGLLNHEFHPPAPDFFQSAYSSTRSRGSTLFSRKGESRGRTATCSRNESHADGQGCLRGASKLRAASHLAYKLGGGRQRVFIIQPEASGAAALFQYQTFYFTSLIHSCSNLSFGASQCMSLSDLSADFLDEESSLTLELRDFTVCALFPFC